MGDFERIPLYMSGGADSVVSCTLCPHRCEIEPDSTGLCGVRGNISGTPSLPLYGTVSEIEALPVHKLPLYHFYPTASALFTGILGCTVRSQVFAQWAAEPSRTEYATSISASEVIDNALEAGCKVVALWGGDAALHLEYLEEVAEAARRAKLAVACRTAGFLDRATASRMGEVVDAVVMELPFIDPGVFQREHSLSTDPFFQALRLFEDSETHLEIAVPITEPAQNRPDAARRFLSRIADLNAEIPLHLRVDGTLGTTAENIETIARQYLDFVYVVDRLANTLCPVCERLLITREGNTPTVPGIRRGRCRKCDRIIPGRF